jgi:hypothetical protein
LSRRVLLRVPAASALHEHTAQRADGTRSEHEEWIAALRARRATPAGKALYRLRRPTLELGNADWKGHRQLRRFSGRGLARAQGQVGVLVLAPNLVTLLAE